MRLSTHRTACNIACLMAVMRYVRCVTWLLSELEYTGIAEDSLWCLLVYWCLFGARSFTTIIMALPGWCALLTTFNWRVGMVVTDGLVSADLQPLWWRGPVGSNGDVIKWKHLPRCWPFVPGIHRSPVNSPHKGQWRGALMFSLICAWINTWVNNREAGD